MDCLVFLCETFGKPKSSSALTNGIPYDENGMGPTLFCEAANRIGLKSEIFKKPDITKISSAVLPCILLMKDDQACVMLEKPDANQQVKVFVPETDSIRTISLDHLSEDYMGYAILVHPTAVFKIPERKRAKIEEQHWFWDIVRLSRSTYGLVIIASIFINLFALVSPIFIMNVYDRVIPNNATETGWIMGIGAIVAFMFDFIFRTIRGYLIDFAGRRTDVLAARRIFDHVMDMKLAGRPSSSGAFANILRDFDSVREFFTSATITVLVDLPFTILFLFFIYQLGGSIAFILVGLIMITAFAGFLIQIKLKHLVRNSTQTSQNRHGILVEAINSLETIKAGGADGRFRSRYGTVMSEDAQYAEKSRFFSSMAANISVFFQQNASIMIVLAGMYLVQSGDLTTGGLIASVILGGRAIAPMGQIANLITKYHHAGIALHELNDIMSAPLERPEDVDFLHRPELSGKIAFEKVSFAYPGTSVPVLDEVSFTIQKGERVGIIGRVGSGKSTVAKLLLKLYEPDSGVILADDTDYRQIDPADLRKNTAYISQDTQLFRGTIRDNITAFNPQANEDQVLEYARQCGVDGFASRHPLGYDAPVGELGANLSGGQKQAIAFARAMITSPNILICDEPTSSMDTQTESVFCTYVQEQTKDKTFILITHKQALLTTVDRLILMHNGKVVMDGPRDEVIAALNSGKVKVKKD